MADIPTPQSYNEILGNMITAFLAKYPINTLKVGGPILTLLEAAAQSDFRATNEIFTLLGATSLNTATGVALDRIAADEDTVRIGASPANGTVTVTDTRYTKKSSTIYGGSFLPVVGTTSLNVNATGFDLVTDQTGQIYIGRGTLNYEGPISYTAITDNGNYYTITLSTGTQMPHKYGEEVTKAQGGNRAIPAGSIVQTAQGNLSTAMQYSVLYNAVIPDGEVSVYGVQVVCTKAGTQGNVATNGIVQFLTTPFTGATATNPLPFTNGVDIESDDELRNRIRNIRQTRSRATSLAIKNSLVGVISPDENKRIISVSVLAREGYPTTTYIDDGTGYEELTQNQPYEALTNSAIGGEQYFQLDYGHPVTKAFRKTSLSGPFSLTDQSVLTAYVSGVLTTHTFSSSEFANISYAQPWEVAHSINSDISCLFAATTSDSGSTVTIFAKDDVRNTLRVLSTGANVNLGFPTTEASDVHLYKNDIPLLKEGMQAIVYSNAQNIWNSLTSPATIILSIDNTPLTTYTITDTAFANTGYATLSQSNSLASWKTALESIIPGITVDITDSGLGIRSNAGYSSKASVVISGGTLVTTNMFNVASAYGADSDFTLNRNTGQLFLNTALEAGDELTAGSTNTRGYIQGTPISTATSIGGRFWSVVDGDPSILSVNLTGLTAITVTNPSGSNYRFTFTGVTGNTGNKVGLWSVSVGDYVIFYDALFPAANRHAFRIDAVNNSGTPYIESIFKGGSVGATSVTPAAGIIFVRAENWIQLANISTSANALAPTLAGIINAAGLRGETATVIQNSTIRLATNTASTSTGSLGLLAADSTIKTPLGWVTPTISNSIDSHLAVVETTNSQLGTPNIWAITATGVPTSAYNINWNASVGNTVIPLNSFVVGQRTGSTVGNREWFSSPVSAQDLTSYPTVNATLRYTKSTLDWGWWVSGENYYVASPFSIGYQDTLNTYVRGSQSGQNWNSQWTVRMGRKVTPTGTYTGSTFTFLDADNSNSALSAAFGTAFDFSDWALFMPSRAILGSNNNDYIKVSYKLLGTDPWLSYAAGQQPLVRFEPPTAYGQAASASVIFGGVDASAYQVTAPIIQLRLPSNRSNVSRYTPINSTACIGVCYTGTTAGGAYTWAIAGGFNITAISRDAGGLVTVTLATGAVSRNHGFVAAIDRLYVQPSAADQAAGFNAGSYNIAGTPAYNQITYYQGTGALTGVGGGLVTKDVNPVGAGIWDNVTFPAPTNTNYVMAVPTDVNLRDGAGGGQPLMVISIDATGSYRTIANVEGVVNADYPNQTLTTAHSIYLWTTSPVGDNINTSAPSLVFTCGGTASEISSDINANAYSPITTSVVTGSSVYKAPRWSTLWDGTGKASWVPDSSGVIGVAALMDGINYVQSSAYTSDYTFTMKSAVSTTLTNQFGWSSENVYLVPTTVKNIVDYLNLTSISGMAQDVTALASGGGNKLQLATTRMGSGNQLKVEGGTANSAEATILAIDNTFAQFLTVYISQADASGFYPGNYVKLQNYIPTQKTNSGAGFTVSSTSGAGQWTFSSAIGKYIVNSNTNTASVNKQGNLLCFRVLSGTSPTYTFSGGAPVSSGDYVRVSGFNSLNNGVYRVVRADSITNCIWVEAPASGGVEEYVSGTIGFTFATATSPVAGDTIVIGSTELGANNVGTYVISQTRLETGIGDTVLYTTTPTPTTFAGPSTLVTGMVIQSATPHVAVARIKGIIPETSSTGNVAMALDFYPASGSAPTIYSLLYGPYYETKMIAMNKFAFPSSISYGMDAYNYSVGLIGEANKVLYGDASDTTTYPGVVAAGSNVNINPPIVRRVTIGLELRLSSLSTKQETFDAVRNAVATFINASPIGQPIAISQVISVVSAIGGIQSVAIISPAYDINNDQIAVQPYEKAMIMDPESDITLVVINQQS